MSAMTEKQATTDVQDEGTTISPYLLRPRRSYAQVLRDLKRPTAEEPGVRCQRGTGAASLRTRQR